MTVAASCAAACADEAARKITARATLFGTNVLSVPVGRSIQNGFEEGLHRGRVVDAIPGECRLGVLVGLPVEKRVTRPANLDVLRALPRLDERIEKLLRIGMLDETVVRAAHLELRHCPFLCGGNVVQRRDRLLPRLDSRGIIRIEIEPGSA